MQVARTTSFPWANRLHIACVITNRNACHLRRNPIRTSFGARKSILKIGQMSQFVT